MERNINEYLTDRYKIVKEKLAEANPLVVASIKNGIILIAENPTVLKKTAEVYDRIAYGAIGKYVEFNSLRKEIIYIADMMGYNYARQDVTIERLVTHLAEKLQIAFANFKSQPLVVEIILAEINSKPENDKIFKIASDGDIQPCPSYAVIGRDADKIIQNLKTALGDRQLADLSKGEAILLIKEAIVSSKKDPTEEVQFEISYLNRKKTGRCFERIKLQ